MKKPVQNKSHAGFTLIELLIALAITGMVAAVIAGAAFGNNPVNNITVNLNSLSSTPWDGYSPGYFINDAVAQNPWDLNK